jgi:diguanylate cyclase (GGDEF)-like protein
LLPIKYEATGPRDVPTEQEDAVTALQDGPATDPAAYPLGEADELARLGVLRGYGLLDQPREDSLDALARLAAYVCSTPTAVVNLLDADRQWQAAAHGCPTGQVPRDASMCARTVLAPDAPDVTHVADASLDPRFTDNPFVTGAVGNVRLYASVPLRAPSGHVLGSLCVFDDRPGELSAEQLALLQDLGRQVVELFELRRVSTLAGRLALTDPLTGLPNRRAADAALASAIRRAERGLGTPSIVVVDLDGFKEVNDRDGHAAGDAVLRWVATQLSSTARGVDLVARTGGDEFVVLLEHTGGSGAVAAVDRLRRALTDPEGALPAVSASVGFATYRPGDSPASLLSRADAEMYGEKVRARA